MPQDFSQVARVQRRESIQDEVSYYLVKSSLNLDVVNSESGTIKYMYICYTFLKDQNFFISTYITFKYADFETLL